MSKNRKSINFIRDAWLISCIVLFLLILLESSLYVVFLVRDNDDALTSQTVDRPSEADTYNGASWTEDYFKEFHESHNVRWEPYVYWRRKPYEGKYINVTRDGLRLTPNSEMSSDRESTTLIFLFGGSTMWGTGARDSFTIPAVLSLELKKRGVSTEVRNFGETGYVSTQELAALTLQLRKGVIPDVAIFYDGVNDTFSAYQQGIAGLPQNEFRRAREFNLTNPDMRQDLAREGLKASSTMRFMCGVLGRLGLREQTTSNENREDLAQDVVTIYANNVQMVKALAASYGFKCLFYWQPTIFGKNILTEYEKINLDKVEYDHKSFFDMTYGRMRKEGRPFLADSAFQDLSDIFLDTHEPIYIDWMHLGERGNWIIAQRIADDTIRLLEADVRVGEENVLAPDLRTTRQ